MIYQEVLTGLLILEVRAAHRRPFKGDDSQAAMLRTDLNSVIYSRSPGLEMKRSNFLNKPKIGDTVMCNFTVKRTIVIYLVGTRQIDEKRADLGVGKNYSYKEWLTTLIKLLKSIIMLKGLYNLLSDIFS